MLNPHWNDFGDSGGRGQISFPCPLLSACDWTVPLLNIYNAFNTFVSWNLNLVQFLWFKIFFCIPDKLSSPHNSHNSSFIYGTNCSVYFSSPLLILFLAFPHWVSSPSQWWKDVVRAKPVFLIPDSSSFLRVKEGKASILSSTLMFAECLFGVCLSCLSLVWKIPVSRLGPCSSILFCE